MKQVSNSVQAAASGRDPDSHQSIAVWWFLTKEVQGKNSSGGDLSPASWGVVTAWLINKKREEAYICSHVDSKTHCPLPPPLGGIGAFCSVLDGRGALSAEIQKWRGLSPYTPPEVTLISGWYHLVHSNSLPSQISGPLCCPLSRISL